MLDKPPSRLRFSVSRPVAASHTRVFEALTSEAGMRRWLPMCKSARWEHPEGKTSLCVGSIRRIVLAGGIVADEKIIAWEDGVGLHYGFVNPAFPLARLTEHYVGVTRIEKTGANECILHWAAHFDGRGFKGAVAPALAATLRPMMSGMVDRLKAIAEQG